MSATGPDYTAASFAVQACPGRRDSGYAQDGPEGPGGTRRPRNAQRKGKARAPRLVGFARVPPRSSKSVSRLPSRRTTRLPFPFSEERHPSLQTGESREGRLAASGGRPKVTRRCPVFPLKQHFRVVKSTSTVASPAGHLADGKNNDPKNRRQGRRHCVLHRSTSLLCRRPHRCRFIVFHSRELRQGRLAAFPEAAPSERREPQSG